MKQRPANIGFCILAIAGFATAFAMALSKSPNQSAIVGNGDSEKTIKLAEAPEPVRTAVAKLSTPDKVKQVIVESHHGVNIYEIEYTADGVDCSVDLTAGGDVLSLEKAVKDGNLPAAAVAAIKQHYPNATIKQSASVQEFFFEVELQNGGVAQEIKVNATGQLNDDDDEDDDQGQADDDSDEDEGDDDDED